MRQKKRKEAVAVSGEKSKDNTATRDTIVVKRARSTQSKFATLTPIQCTSCKNTDVPLILGGSEFTCASC